MNEVFRQKLLRITRSLGLMSCAEKMREAVIRWRNRRSNRDFVARHPDIALPLLGLMHDPYGTVDYAWYWESGKNAAAELSAIIGQHCPVGPGPLRVLEWGCGPARVIRHLEPASAGTSFERFATDYNGAMIDWCRANIPTVTFEVNALTPPLHQADGSFDFIYALSVFTHLSEVMHHAWLKELLRVLKPGGCLLLTLHGDYYRRKLLADERARYDAGELVVREGFAEGGRMYTAFHGERFVRERWLRSVEILRHDPADNQVAPPQDVWLVRKAA